MQVRTNPRQIGGTECGVHAGLQAEILCSHYQGSLRIKNGEPYCDGQHANFLQDERVWHNTADVHGLRILLCAAAMSLWTYQCPQCPVMEDAYKAAHGKMKRALRDESVMPAREDLWYGYTTSSDNLEPELHVAGGLLGHLVWPSPDMAAFSYSGCCVGSSFRTVPWHAGGLCSVPKGLPMKFAQIWSQHEPCPGLVQVADAGV